MATKQRSRSRRSSPSRDRGPRYVAPVLDPNWQSPYAPTNAEKHHNQKVVRSFAMRKKLPESIGVGVVVLVLVVGVVVAPWVPVVGIAVALLYAWDLRRSLVRYEAKGLALGNLVLDQFKAGGTEKDRLRLATVMDRLAATFGVDAVSIYIVSDPGYNAALVPTGSGLSFFVTDALMRDFELIELEGVVAHCLARHRLGLLLRESLASVAATSDDSRRALAGQGLAYRADEVAAAAIRYPPGLAEALRKCAGENLSSTSFFAGTTYAQWRWIWFNMWSDRASDLSDLDDVELRARALEEW
jgi:Zn-dependent protease with chaperone function